MKIGELTEYELSFKDAIDALELVASETGYVLEELRRHECPKNALINISEKESQTLAQTQPDPKITEFLLFDNSSTRINPSVSSTQTACIKMGKQPNLKIKELFSKADVLIKSKPHYQVQKGSFTTKSESDSKTDYPKVDISKSPKRYVIPTVKCPERWPSKQKKNNVFKKSAVQSLVYKDPLKTLKEQVEIAIREKKTFTVCGNYYALRRALLSRGWVEKMRILYNTVDRENLKHLQQLSISELLPGLKDPQKGHVYKRMIMTKLLGVHQVDFYWDQNFDCFRMLSDKVKYTMVNRFKRGIFNYVTKSGLCETMKKAYWYQFPTVSNLQQPRSYNLSIAGEPQDFIRDFKETAAISLLKWIARSRYRGGKFKIISDEGKVPISTYHFATKEVLKILRIHNHENIDYEIEEAPDYEWNKFLANYYTIVHMGSHFKSCDIIDVETVPHMQKSSVKLLNELQEFRPQMKMDGLMNVWILKPMHGCRGNGIYLCKTLEYVLKLIKSNAPRRYIVQKYIERPLLIHNTKFDIRQWFLISCTYPLTIWIYKECYVRMSSQLYNLHKLHESIHLTNNSIQSRYKNCTRNENLPECNMWDSKQFQKYLTSIGQPTVYKNIIYPGMKECLTAAILINKDNLDTRTNCFEIYGSDFMLTEDFKPWLIEINSTPALSASTPVTARMCPRMLEDVIKVMIDYKKNPQESTGAFQLLYEEKFEKLPKIDEQKMHLVGTPLPKDYFIKDYNSNVQSTESSQTSLGINITQISSEMKKTLQNLLDMLNKEREKRINLQNISVQSNDYEFFDKKSIPLQDVESQVEHLSVESKTVQCIDYREFEYERLIKLINNKNLSASDIVTTKASSSYKSSNSECAMKIATENKEQTLEEMYSDNETASISSSEEQGRNLFQTIIESIRNLSIN